MDPTQLGPFTVIEKLGEGGMGVVYKARDSRLERFVAIKLLPEARLADAGRRARFMQEARAASALNHPNIITIYDIAEQDGRTYMVMELVNGKQLDQVSPRKGMRLTDGLRIATQIADALSAAHAAGIVHRDLKPGNIMVDANGRVKVLDFGLAKLTAPPETATPATDETATVAMDNPQTEEGAIVGSVPYMSPEQAEGRPVDARSDIFSFGAVLYEMFSGHRAFQGESRISTLAAVVERDPEPLGKSVPGIPLELERLIARCLRKDVARRSQNMSDVKLSLEELRDESESGTLMRAPGGVTPPSPANRKWQWRWRWQAMGAAAVLIAALAIWVERPRSAAAPATAQLTRVTPDDGYSYTNPAISPDGKFVASISDRGGTSQVWLQQVGGGEPIQVTHSPDPVQGMSFFPDGTHLLVRSTDGGKGTLEVIPTLGGQARVLFSAENLFDAELSPDGRQVAYSGRSSGEYHINVISSDGGAPRVLNKWTNTQAQATITAISWLPDSRNLLVVGSKLRGAPNLDEWEWFVLPVDGGDPIPTGAGDALRAAGIGLTFAHVDMEGRLLFGSTIGAERGNARELPIDSKSWHVSGPPRQLTFGTENATPWSVSAGGTVALEISHRVSDFFLIPVAPDTGQPNAPARRLTQDGRTKGFWPAGGDPGLLYFLIVDAASRGLTLNTFSIDLTSSTQTQVYRNLVLNTAATFSLDGRQASLSIPNGDHYAIKVGAVGSSIESAHPLCENCGRAYRFTPDGKYLVCRTEARPKNDAKQKYTATLLDVASGKVTPWLEDPAESITVNGFLVRDWVLVSTDRPGDESSLREWIVPMRTEPVPRSEWIEFHPPAKTWKYGVITPFIYGFQKSQLMAMKFDVTQRKWSEPFPVRQMSGGATELRPDESFNIRGPGIAFQHAQTSASVWLMKLP